MGLRLGPVRHLTHPFSPDLSTKVFEQKGRSEPTDIHYDIHPH